MNVIKIPAKPQKGNAAAKEEVKRLRVGGILPCLNGQRGTGFQLRGADPAL